MARIESYSMTLDERQRRHFSEGFKRERVKELDRKAVKIAELCKEYEISRKTVYNWIYMFSQKRKKGETIRIEAESDTVKLQELRRQVQELEQIIGQKQLLIDFQNKVIEMAEEEYKVDIKKKLGGKLHSGTGIIGTNTR